MLRLDNLTVRYGRVTGVRDLSLHVEAGQLVGLVGPNGAGKSTTMLAVAGALDAAAGTVSLDGTSINGKGPEAVARRGVRLVPEGRHVFARLTVEENLLLGATGRRDRHEVQADLERELERFPVLRRTFKNGAGKLSGGEQQQLVISRALLGRPRLLLLDEPSLGLAPLMVDLVFETLEQLRADGVTVLLVEQLAGRTIRTCDRTYVLQGGRLQADGTAEELDAEEIESAYLGKATST